MAQKRQSRPDRELDKFLESQLRPTHSAVDVVVGNDVSHPIPVILAEDAVQGDVLNTYDSVSSLAKDSMVTLVTYTVPVGKTLYLRFVEVGGENIAKYVVDVDSSVIGLKRTYHGAGLNETFDFFNLKLNAGEVVTVSVEHGRPNTSDHEGRIIGNLI